MKRDLPPGGPLSDPDEEVRSEIEFYLEERARELEAQGMDPEAARREAGRAFGDVDRISRQVRKIRRGRERDERRTRVVDSIQRDFKVAVRGLLKRPAFSAVVIGTLALGIGAVTAVFSVVNASLLRALPFEEADRLVFLQGAYDAPEGPAVRGASVPEALDWKSMSRSFSEVALVNGGAVTLTGEGVAERVPIEQIGDGYFELLRVEPLVGRLFTAEELALPSDERVALLGEALWTSRFGRDPEILGRSIRVNAQPVTVVGVLPESFPGTSLQAELFLPLGNPIVGVQDGVDERGSRFLGVVARLREGTDVAAAQAEMDGIAARLEEAYPENHEDRIALVTPLRDAYLGSTRTLVLVVLGASALLLLIAAANVANLLLVRATGRSGEVLMRKALGAGQGRLMAHFLTESTLLAGIGAFLGLFIGMQGAHSLAAAMPPALLPAYVDVGPDLTVFATVAGLMALIGVGAGLTPALGAARLDVASGLREAGAGRHSRLQHALVVGEVALALILLVGAGLMTRSFRAQLAIDAGFDAEELYAFGITLPSESYSRESVVPAIQDLEARLEGAPGVARVTYGADAPLRGGYTASYIYMEGASAEDRIRFYIHRVAEDWFETLGTRMLAGRPLQRSDLDDPNVTVIGRALAERFFPAGDAVGGTIRLFSPDGQQLRVVGVAEDARFRDLTTDLVAGADDPDIYVMWDSLPSRSVSFVLRSALRAGSDPAAMEQTVREVVAGFDRDLPVFDPAPLSQALEGQTAQARFGSLLLTTFSGLAAFLAVVGLYGVLSFSVDRRRREIAVRMAMGAEASRVRRMVVWQGMRLAAVGLALGLGAAWLASGTLEAFLFSVEPVDARTYAGVAALMAMVAMAAAWVPAVKATRIDPQKALKID